MALSLLVIIKLWLFFGFDFQVSTFQFPPILNLFTNSLQMSSKWFEIVPANRQIPQILINSEFLLLLKFQNNLFSTVEYIFYVRNCESKGSKRFT